MLGWYANQAGAQGTLFAPMYTYTQERGPQGGSRATDDLDVAQYQGNDTVADYQAHGDDPYGNTLGYDTVSFSLPKPSTAEQANAKQYMIKGHHSVWAQYDGIGSTAQSLLENELGNNKRPVAIASYLGTNFTMANITKDNPYYTTNGYRQEGSHEMLALGYDSWGLYVQNSWGQSFGVNGRFWMSWATVESDVYEADVIDGGFVNNINVDNNDTQGPTMGAVTTSIAGGQVGTTVPVKVKWSAQDASGVAQYELWVKTGTGSWVDNSSHLASPSSTSVTFLLTRGTQYRFAVTAKDTAGNWSDYGYSRTIKPSVFDDNQYLTYSTGWGRYTWASAYGGSEVTTHTAGAWAKFTFTGTSVALVAPRATNRGKAIVYVDGVGVATLDNYSSSTIARSVVFSRTFSSSGTHTVVIKSLATAGRPYTDVDAFVIM